MKKIIIILPYFGKLPNYFKFFLESCKKNDTIDFLIITDNTIKCDSSNINIINCSFDEIKRKIQSKFQYEISLERPYKLCDYKLFYGYIFNEYISNYDFWGFCDCDLIFGDIRKFITEDILEKYSYILSLGHFHLSKNNDESLEKILNSYISNKGYDIKYILSHDTNFTIDELPFGIPYWYYKQFPSLFYSGFYKDKRIYDSITNVYIGFVDTYNCGFELKQKYQRTMYYQYKTLIPFWERSFNRIYKTNIIYEYNNGQLYRNFINKYTNQNEKEELLYVHFYKRKIEIECNNLSRYIISPNIIKEYKNITPSLLKKLNSPYQFFKLYLKKKKEKAITKIKIIIKSK